MARSRTIRELRLLHGNPYAYMEHLEEAAAAPRSEVSESRKLLGNPYAYLDDDGGYTASGAPPGTAALVEQLLNRYRPPVQAPTSRSQSRLPTYSDAEIEAKVQALHRHLWKERAALWPEGVPAEPIAMLDPTVALAMLGYSVDLLPSGLGQYHTGRSTVDVAGLINTASRSVQISGMLGSEVQRFTAAHELAHAVLHPDAVGVHRDRPLDGIASSRERPERDADRFATLWLMPAKLMASEFKSAFLQNRFVLNTDTAFDLLGRSPDEVAKAYPTRRHLSRLIASASHYAGKQIYPLATRFRVSTETMAIRLEELELVS
jgi:hypothetical protein